MIKLIPENSSYLGKGTGGKTILAAQLICDTCAELADVSEADGNILGFGSVALAVRDGEICALSSNGTWYRQSNGSAVEAESN